MPGMVLLRPADASEVVDAGKVIIGITERPESLVLSRAKGFAARLVSMPCWDLSRASAPSIASAFCRTR